MPLNLNLRKEACETTLTISVATNYTKDCLFKSKLEIPYRHTGIYYRGWLGVAHRIKLFM